MMFQWCNRKNKNNNRNKTWLSSSLSSSPSISNVQTSTSLLCIAMLTILYTLHMKWSRFHFFFFASFFFLHSFPHSFINFYDAWDTSWTWTFLFYTVCCQNKNSILSVLTIIWPKGLNKYFFFLLNKNNMVLFTCMYLYICRWGIYTRYVQKINRYF